MDKSVIKQFQGRKVFGEPHTEILTKKSPLEEKPGTIDYYQLDEQIKCVPETAEYLYEEYSPTKIKYKSGTRPLLEKIAKTVTAGAKNDEERVIAIMRWIQSRMTHPNYKTLPAGLTEEEMILNIGSPQCNLCARIFCMLTQVIGIPSRMVFLYSSFVNKHGGCEHTIAEAYIDRKWGVIDPRVKEDGRVYLNNAGQIASALEIQQNPEILTRTLSKQEHKDALENGGVSDVRMFNQFAICNYLITDARPARESDDVLPKEWQGGVSNSAGSA